MFIQIGRESTIEYLKVSEQWLDNNDGNIIIEKVYQFLERIINSNKDIKSSYVCIIKDYMYNFSRIEIYIPPRILIGE